jgi:hypothetical protein
MDMVDDSDEDTRQRPQELNTAVAFTEGDTNEVSEKQEDKM